MIRLKRIIWGFPEFPIRTAVSTNLIIDISMVCQADLVRFAISIRIDWA